MARAIAVELAASFTVSHNPSTEISRLYSPTENAFAGTCEVKLTFEKGGHAAFPHEANDALVAASYFITQVQTIHAMSILSRSSCD